jgi:hypothetical protein
MDLMRLGYDLRPAMGDGLAINRIFAYSVIPVQTGIQSLQTRWIPAFAGMTTFYETIM